MGLLSCVVNLLVTFLKKGWTGFQSAEEWVLHLCCCSPPLPLLPLLVLAIPLPCLSLLSWNLFTPPTGLLSIYTSSESQNPSISEETPPDSLYGLRPEMPTLNAYSLKSETFGGPQRSVKLRSRRGFCWMNEGDQLGKDTGFRDLQSSSAHLGILYSLNTVSCQSLPLPLRHSTALETRAT